jgi:hypothetical protein
MDHPAGKKMREESTQMPDEVRQAISLLLQAVGASTHTLVRISDPPGLATRDCYSVARAILEASANICFIMAEGPAAAGKALRHARQKAFRDFQRYSEIGQSVIRLTYKGPLNAVNTGALEADIAEFTARSGREKGWIDESIDERIEAAGRHFGDVVLKRLHFARFMIYRHSSEILHGTLFGVLFFLGATNPKQPTSAVDVLESIAQQQTLILMAIVFSHSAIIESFHQAYGFRRAHDTASGILGSIQAIPYLKARQAASGSEPEGSQ